MKTLTHKQIRENVAHYLKVYEFITATDLTEEINNQGINIEFTYVLAALFTLKDRGKCDHTETFWYPI